ncbi:MAG: hypothetical protein SFV17_07905 [Candidatus Obscuribacter sp.]|nr:hypothetical protein [Candidatus Melainabacteria bacterium]MDX1986596.1 hypothetical protein [Candidatus Obscuribacter sp.]
MNLIANSLPTAVGGSVCSEGGAAGTAGLCEKIESRVFSPLSRKAPRRSIEMEVSYRLKVIARSPASIGLLKETGLSSSVEEALNSIEVFIERSRG